MTQWFAILTDFLLLLLNTTICKSEELGIKKFIITDNLFREQLTTQKIHRITPAEGLI
jgi:hypothetical protein